MDIIRAWLGLRASCSVGSCSGSRRLVGCAAVAAVLVLASLPSCLTLPAAPDGNWTTSARVKVADEDGDDPSAVEDQPHRTRFHFQPEKNWMNGMLRSVHVLCFLVLKISAHVFADWLCQGFWLKWVLLIPNADETACIV